ncbi:hypothetical protein F7731_23620 [Cytobacillus depressus]|uniref:ParB-like N-terminal domain-containing protein n=1 Tax=Cytobacillus depressus TaxID=1602942 RepID=A0A6L3UXN4_9BACI|nr:ParB N-terminal domain-containing protein [Cytobacillus depressus]KAB2328945.1 hypothetical protein F7731_23620 [Cytobacillus depressus]
MNSTKEAKINTKIVSANPRDLKLLELNARYMRHETFQQLVSNIQRDGKLTQLPFCIWEDGHWKVLSGNHRVKAAIEAGLDTIEFIGTEDKLSQDRQRAIQLSHNAISGEDDPTILKTLYEEIEDIDFKMYAGLDDKTLELLEKVQPESLSEVNLEFQTMNIVFLPSELEKAKEMIDEIQKEVKADEVWLASMQAYDNFLDSMEAVSTSYDVKNVALTLLILLGIVQRNLDQLSDGWYDEEEQEAKHKNWIPLSTIFNHHKIPSKSGAVVKKALDRMLSKGELEKQQKWEALEYWATQYLQGD